MLNGANIYKQIAAQEVLTTSPYRVIQMLMQGVLDNLSIAKSAILEKKHLVKLQAIDRAINIIIELQASLDFKQGGQIAEELDRLYQFMTSRLVDINASNNAEKLHAVTQVMQDIKQGWDGINPDKEENRGSENE